MTEALGAEADRTRGAQPSAGSGEDVFHSGEIAVQERTGERSLALRRGANIAGRLPEGATAFLARQTIAAVAAAGDDGALWPALWCGEPGFLRAGTDGASLEVLASLDRTTQTDPVRPLLHADAPLGMLVIDFLTRQRLRINGAVARADAGCLEVRVRESFGNCPKYIQRRQRSDGASSGSPAGPVERGRALDTVRLDRIARADTAFVASAHPERGLDVSHRGGEPGFVRLTGERTLRIPDYPGNAMYQTLGNFAVDPRAGLAVMDFEQGRMLSLTGRATATFGVEHAQHPTGGTGRYWSFTVYRWVDVPLAPGAWTLLERSPRNPPSHA
jgi:predicted pyridoxine 5'-phosphate oxidase superfamily flavin-nucleotide-binding protein